MTVWGWMSPHSSHWKHLHPLWGPTETRWYTTEESRLDVLFSQCYVNVVWVLSHFSCVWLFVILWTRACQAPLFMGFSKEEYWSGLPFPSPGDLPNPGIEPTSLTSPAMAGEFFTTYATWEAHPILILAVYKIWMGKLLYIKSPKARVSVCWGGWKVYWNITINSANTYRLVMYKDQC